MSGFVWSVDSDLKLSLSLCHDSNSTHQEGPHVLVSLENTIYHSLSELPEQSYTHYIQSHTYVFKLKTAMKRC